MWWQRQGTDAGGGRRVTGASWTTNLPASFASQAEALQVFDNLDVIEPADLVGLWQGRGIAAGHPLDGVLENLGWYGKRFRADQRADALLFRTGAQRLAAIDPARISLHLALRFHRFGRTAVARNWFSYLVRGLRARGPVATVQRLPFRGRSSAAMVYDRQPIVDHFRAFDAEHMLGVMTIRDDDQFYFFVLERQHGERTEEPSR